MHDELSSISFVLSVLQIRRGNRDDLWIISHISLEKHIL